MTKLVIQVLAVMYVVSTVGSKMKFDLLDLPEMCYHLTYDSYRPVAYNLVL